MKIKKILSAFTAFTLLFIGLNIVNAVNPPPPNSKLNGGGENGEIDMGETSIGIINEKSSDLQTQLKKILEALRFGDLGSGLNNVGESAKVDISRFILKSSPSGEISIYPNNTVLFGLNEYKHIIFPGGEWSSFVKGDEGTGEKKFGKLYTEGNIGKHIVVAIKNERGYISYITGRLKKSYNDYENGKANGILDFNEISDNGEEVINKAKIKIEKISSASNKIECQRQKTSSEGINDICKIIETHKYEITLLNKPENGKVKQITSIRGVLSRSGSVGIDLSDKFKVKNNCNNQLSLGIGLQTCTLEIAEKTTETYDKDLNSSLKIEIDYNDNKNVIIEYN